MRLNDGIGTITDPPSMLDGLVFHIGWSFGFSDMFVVHTQQVFDVARTAGGPMRMPAVCCPHGAAWTTWCYMDVRFRNLILALRQCPECSGNDNECGQRVPTMWQRHNGYV